MAKKQSGWKTKGMNRDLSVSAFSPEFAFENRNLRLSTNEGNTLLSWVNEKGPSAISIVTVVDSVTQNAVIEGIAIGTAVLNDQLIIFTHRTETGVTNPDFIYKLKYLSGYNQTIMLLTQLFNGNLKFSTSKPLETSVSYEAETIQKVYWTDGKNQPRLINIASDSILQTGSSGRDTQFDFVNVLQLKETVTVKKLVGSSGQFAPGVIQYSFTYYKKNGQETNIFYTTPLLYISNFDRGAKPDDKVENSFKITVEKLDTNFDYLRIYSIQRTSINGTPIVKRIQDIYIKDLTADGSGNKKAQYIDTGYSGDSVDPTELLYKGGEAIIVETMEQKDNTLFLGGITRMEELIFDNTYRATVGGAFTIFPSERRILASHVSDGYYAYGNQLTSDVAYNVEGNWVRGNKTVPCGGFKRGDYYRCGIQFQDKTGKWSVPIYISDFPSSTIPDYSGDLIKIPTLLATTSNSALISQLVNKGFRKARAVVVFPEIQDRVTLCQGIASQTLFTTEGSYKQSSWFFRPYVERSGRIDGVTVTPSFGYINKDIEKYLAYTQRNIGDNYPDGSGSGADHIPIYNPNDDVDELGSGSKIRAVEVQGDFKVANRFQIDKTFLTLHSPDLEFDDSLKTADFTGAQYKQVGMVRFVKTMSDIDIQTSSATISSAGSGFIHKSFKKDSPHGIVSGLFYDDYSVNDESDNGFKKNSAQKAPMKFMVYPWQKNGSLNNDINRPAEGGTPSAVLKKKIISNLRYARTLYLPKYNNVTPTTFNISPYLYQSEEPTILKVGETLYSGNVDSLAVPDRPDGVYFAFDGVSNITRTEVPLQGIVVIDCDFTKTETAFNSTNWGKTFSLSDNAAAKEGLYMHYTYTESSQDYETWARINDAAGEEFVEMVMKKEGVRIKYKSTPHLAMTLNSGSTLEWHDNQIEGCQRFTLPIVEIKQAVDQNLIFGGMTKDAFRENNWVPCGEPVSLYDSSGNVKTSLTVNYDYGDTYFQRWDCLKTYAFTPEDVNQVVEIGSFMLETRVNIDGRYDRNRGQQNNLYMSPQNFNLLNPVYSQIDNFFTYKILDDDYYKNVAYPNQITWSKTKQNGADVDAWTNITLASVLELDGDKGKITSLQRFNDQLIAFQDEGISRILFNENTMLSTTEGVPVEISNSGKVQGDSYISNTVGCSNKWSIINTPFGIYFMDSNDKSIYLFNGQLNNLSVQKGFNTWCKQNIPSAEKKWDPVAFNNFMACYDKMNQDVLYINNSTALAFSEKLGNFTSFYDYGGVPFFNNLNDTGIWSRPYYNNEQERWYTGLWKHNAGNYCNFFGTNKPYSMTLVGNPEPQMDKIFTNLEFRACVDGEYSSTPATPLLPFNSLETWDEYQHGLANIDTRSGHSAFKHHTTDNNASLKRKFRIWRCDIPRDNADLSTDTALNITRAAKHPLDRMRNPWLYLKLVKNAQANMPRAEIHDIVMTYFD